MTVLGSLSQTFGDPDDNPHDSPHFPHTVSKLRKKGPYRTPVSNGAPRELRNALVRVNQSQRLVFSQRVKIMNVQSTVKTADNGVNVDALLGARAVLSDAPAAAQFTWRAECDWINGAHSRSTMKTFFGLGEEQSHNSEFTLDADHPPQFAASDNGATPTEIVLSALASCLIGGIASVAQHRDIQLRSVKARVEGDVNVYGVLGMDADVRSGFNAVRVYFDIDADASDDEIAAVVAQSQKLSAVFDIITNPGNVQVIV